jgi:hypothetical protein
MPIQYRDFLEALVEPLTALLQEDKLPFNWTRDDVEYPNDMWVVTDLSGKSSIKGFFGSYHEVQPLQGFVEHKVYIPRGTV